MEEEWKSVYGYEGQYEVSNCGRVRSKYPYYFDHILTTRLNGEGYETVVLYKNGKTRNTFVHVLVKQAFDFRERRGGYDKNLVIDHIDGNRTNNRIDNLEWCTQSENVRRSIEKGNRGRQCVDVTTGEVFKSISDAARSIGTTTTSVKRVCDRERKKCKNHVFRYLGTKGAYKTRK